MHNKLVSHDLSYLFAWNKVLSRKELNNIRGSSDLSIRESCPDTGGTYINDLLTISITGGMADCRHHSSAFEVNEKRHKSTDGAALFHLKEIPLWYWLAMLCHLNYKTTRYGCL